MRKLIVVGAALAMLTMCATSHGYILVYDVSAPVKGVADITAASISCKGYLAVEIADDTGILMDGTLLLYGMDTTKQRKYVELVYGLDGLLGGEVQSKGEYLVVNFWSGPEPFNFEVLVVGKVKAADIGFGKELPVPVANSLRGTIIVWSGMLLTPGQDIDGTGNVSIRLNIAKTKMANSGGASMADLITEIRLFLAERGYTEVIP